MGAQDNVNVGRFAASFPYRPEDWKSLENDVAEPPNRPQNVVNALLPDKPSPKNLWNLAAPGTDFDFELNLVGLPIPRLAMCQMGGGRCSPRRGIQLNKSKLPKPLQTTNYYGKTFNND